MNKFVFFMILLFFISGTFTVFNPASASELVADSWSTKTPMNDPRSNLGIVAVDGKIYAIGGYASVDTSDGTFLSFLGTNECYDSTTDTWVTLKPMPTPRGNFIIVVCQGKIYCIGGSDGTIYPLGPPLLHPLDVVEVYDPLADKWESKASLPVYVHQGMQTKVVNGQIFILTPTGELYMYNPVVDSWSGKVSLPVKEEPLCFHVANEQLFVITPSIIYIYDTVADTWLNKTSMPVLMTYAFSVVMDNKIIVGNFLLTPSTETLWRGLFNAKLRISIYDPTSDVWHDGKTTDEHIFATNPIFNAVTATMTTGVYAPKNVYVLGIEAVKEDLRNVKPFTWVYDPIGDVWSTATAVDTAPYIKGCQIVVIDDVLYIVGNAFNVKYMPADYTPQGYPDDTLTSAFTWPVVVAAVLTVGAVVGVSLFFYLRKKTRNKQEL